jgi:hypothetical protein
MDKNQLIKYIRSLGVEVNTTTNARGHQGFYLKKRIDISKNIPQERIIPTLLHEFTHYIHSQIEPEMERYGGSLEKIFDTNRIDIFEQELLKITFLVDKNSKFEKLELHKNIIKNKIKEYEKIIKNKYPKFMRSKKFKEFDKYIKNSKAKYLLKHDRIKLISGFLRRKEEIFTIDNIEKDFCDMPKEFIAYIRLKSCQKRQSRISSKINKLRKYYSKPTELFARYVEGLYLYPEKVTNTAPYTTHYFFELLNSGYYKELKNVIELFYRPVNL